MSSSTEFLTCKYLTDLSISHNNFSSINNVLREYKLQQLIKDFNLFIKQCYLTVKNVEKYRNQKPNGFKHK